MDLAEAFRNYREKIVGQWLNYTLSTYTSSHFFSKERDKFANPVGANIRDALDKLFVLLSTGADPEEYKVPVGQIMQLRAVQEFSPSQAVGAVFLLKEAVRAELAGKVTGDRGYAELLDFESRVDRLALMAFDIYMKCREEVCEIRINEVAAQREMALRILAAAGGTGDPA